MTVTVTVTRVTRRQECVETVETTLRVTIVRSVETVTMVIPLMDRVVRFVLVRYLSLETLLELATTIRSLVICSLLIDSIFNLIIRTSMGLLGFHVVYSKTPIYRSSWGMSSGSANRGFTVILKLLLQIVS